jgi:hypothetical protein
VGTFAKAVLVLLIVLSIATILFTPDPNDDVLGILHQQHVLTAQPVFLSLVQTSVSTESLAVPDASVSVLLSADLIDLVCNRLC